jgi:hypothetical protein
VKRTACLVVTAVAVVAAATEAGGGAPSRIIDRTFRCTPAAVSPGLRELDVLAVPVGKRLTGRLDESPSPGYISMNTGGWKLGSEIVAVRARAWQRFAASGPPGVYADAAACRPARESLPLTPKGLPGPPTRWRDNVSCTVSGRVLVRVRAVLQSPASWQRISQSHFGAPRNVLEAALAIRAERSRRPLALLRLDSQGQTKLWTSPGCG